MRSHEWLSTGSALGPHALCQGGGPGPVRVCGCFLLVWVIVEPTGVGAACPGWGAFGGVEPSLASGAQKGACQLLFMTSRERENRALGPGKSP